MEVGSHALQAGSLIWDTREAPIDSNFMPDKLKYWQSYVLLIVFTNYTAYMFSHSAVSDSLPPQGL